MKLKLDLKRVGSVILGRVLEQDESLRNNLDLSVDNFAIDSCNWPQLRNDRLFIRGRARNYDDDLFYYDYKTKEKAIAVQEKIINLVNMINGEQKESDTLLDVELKQVGSVVFGRVLKQSESLLEKPGIIIKCCGFTISSWNNPELVGSYLWVRGENKELDDSLFYYDYGTEDAAKTAYGNFRGLIRAINERKAEKQEPPRDRFVVDERSGIIAIYDTHHPQYKETPGCSRKFPWTVASWEGSMSTDGTHWLLDPWQIEKAHALADMLNGRDR